MNFIIQVANDKHTKYAESISVLIEEAAKARGTGIAKRAPEYLVTKMLEGKAIIALLGDDVVGFCYIETWGHGKYVANSGLVVDPKHRNQGLAKKIKEKAFELSRKKYPEAKLFGITTSLAVMKINSDLGYEPVTFSELTDDEVFWAGCKSCPNFDILTRQNRKMCLCTGMLYDPKDKEEKTNIRKRSKIVERLLRLKQNLFLKKKNGQSKDSSETKLASVKLFLSNLI